MSRTRALPPALFLLPALVVMGSRDVSANPMWNEVERPHVAGTAITTPARGRLLKVDLEGLRERLARADATASPVEIELPLPDGGMKRLLARPAPLLARDAARALPEVRTYSAAGMDQGSTARLALTALGVSGILLTAGGTVLLEPLERGRSDLMVSRWMSGADAAGMECDVIEAASAAAPSLPSTFAAGDSLKTFRTIFMATGEYTQDLGGVVAATAQLASQANMIAGILERDAAIHLEIVQLVAFESAATDPYAWTSYFDLIDRNTVVVDSMFGSSSYDVSQVLTLIAGDRTRGVSLAPCVCSPEKGGCVVAVAAPGHSVAFLTMGHELGHALAFAGHTQDRACNRSATTAWEVGSGITIMCSMPAACPPDFQPQRDPWYHAGNIDQLVSHWKTIPDCGTLTATGNSPPSCDAGPDMTIPRSTPFVLSGSAGDPDDGDALACTWEQLDAAPNAADPVYGPLIRWRLPTPSPLRPIPALATVLAGTVDPFEQLPTLDRTMHFRLLVRDNHAGGGGVAWDDRILTVTGEPFAVTSPNGGETFTSGVPIPVTWSVGGGSVAANVDILLSTDGGATWTIFLSNVPNDGSASITYASSQTQAACRIRVEAVGNIFYDVSNGDFTVTGGVTDVPADGRVDLKLRPVQPNPSSGPATVTFDLPGETALDLAVFSVSGARIRTLASGRWPPGTHRVTWNGRDHEDRMVDAGLYWIRLSIGVEARMVRLVRLR